MVFIIIMINLINDALIIIFISSRMTRLTLVTIGMPSSSNATSRVTSPRPCTPRAVLLSACIGDPIELVSKKGNIDDTDKRSCSWLRRPQSLPWPDQHEGVVPVVCHDGDDIIRCGPHVHLEDAEFLGNSADDIIKLREWHNCSRGGIAEEISVRLVVLRVVDGDPVVGGADAPHIIDVNGGIS
jgi:hypothetical protein